MIGGVNHVTFGVRDLETSLGFYVSVLGMREVTRWDTGSYLLAGENWVALIPDEAAAPEPDAGYTHVAFSVKPEDFPKLSERADESEVQFRQENTSEGESLYPLDPDGHRLEIRTSGLLSRLAADRENPPSGMKFFHETDKQEPPAS